MKPLAVNQSIFVHLVYGIVVGGENVEYCAYIEPIFCYYII